jgi:hypothetical protein
LHLTLLHVLNKLQDDKIKEVEGLLKNQLKAPQEFIGQSTVPTKDYIDKIVRLSDDPQPIILDGKKWKTMKTRTKRYLQRKCVIVIRSGDDTILPDVVDFKSPSLRKAVAFHVPRQANCECSIKIVLYST